MAAEPLSCVRVIVTRYGRTPAGMKRPASEGSQENPPLTQIRSNQRRTIPPQPEAQ